MSDKNSYELNSSQLGDISGGKKVGGKAVPKWGNKFKRTENASLEVVKHPVIIEYGGVMPDVIPEDMIKVEPKALDGVTGGSRDERPAVSEKGANNSLGESSRHLLSDEESGFTKSKNIKVAYGFIEPKVPLLIPPEEQVLIESPDESKLLAPPGGKKPK